MIERLDVWAKQYPDSAKKVAENWVFALTQLKEIGVKEGTSVQYTLQCIEHWIELQKLVPFGLIAAARESEAILISTSSSSEEKKREETSQ